MLEVFLFACGICLICVLLYVWRRTELKLPPGPAGNLLWGNSFQIETERFHHNLKNLSEQYGEIFKLKIYGKNVIVLTSSALIKEAFDSDCVLNDRSANSTGDIFYGRKHIGCSNLTKETLYLREFHKSCIPRYFEGNSDFERLVKDEVKRLRLNLTCRPGSDIEPHEFLRIFYENLFSIVLIGEVIPASDADSGVLWDFVDHLFQLIDPKIDGALRSFPFLRYLPGKCSDVYRGTIMARDQLVKRFFDAQKASYVHGRIRGLVDVCILNQQEMLKVGTTWLTDEYIKGVVLDTLAAGMTELLKTIRLFILLMAHHQDVQLKLQKEIDCVTDRHWMPYMEAVMLEIWRYGSQTPLAIPHLCNKDMMLDGYHIPARSVILPNLYGVHHDEQIWGDPWQFRPERFLDGNGNLLSSDVTLMQTVIPFCLGKRECPGQSFARSRTFVVMTSILQGMSILPPENGSLPSADPRDYTRKYPISEPKYKCQFLCR